MAGGQTLVEAALTLPLLLLLIMGVFDLGRAVFAYNSITNGAREAVRLAIVNQDPVLIRQRGISQVAIAETASPSVDVKFYHPTPNADPSTNSQCVAITTGCIAIVTFETTFKPITPIIGNILFKNGVTFKATSAEAVEFPCPNSSLTTSAQCPKQP